MFIVIFIIMPINGYLLTVYDAWFPLLLIFTQIPFVAQTLIGWYKASKTPRVNNLPGHRNPPQPPRREERNGLEL